MSKNHRYLTGYPDVTVFERKSGEDVTLADGRVVQSADVVADAAAIFVLFI
jgi:hypothetical protein